MKNEITSAGTLEPESKMETIFLNFFLISLQLPEAFLKNRACRVTTGQPKRNRKVFYNDAEYNVAEMASKKTLVNWRSYIKHKVNTDHRLVKTNIKTKQIIESRIASKRPKKKYDETKLFHSNKRKNLLSEIQQSTNTEKIRKLKKQRNS